MKGGVLVVRLVQGTSAVVLSVLRTLTHVMCSPNESVMSIAGNVNVWKVLEWAYLSPEVCPYMGMHTGDSCTNRRLV